MLEPDWTNRLRTKKSELDDRRTQLLGVQSSLEGIHFNLFQQNSLNHIVFNKSQNPKKSFEGINLKQVCKVLYWLSTFQLNKRLKRRKIAQLIIDSGLFDPNFYWENNPEIKEKKIDPLGHYLDIGAFEGRNPHPLFNNAYYIEQNQELINSGMNPLAHYILIGALKGKNPHPLFETTYYLEHNPDVAESEINPLFHYINHGATEGRNPHPLFDTFYYSEKYLKLSLSSINPLVHYLYQGAKQGSNPNPLFDTSYYTQQNPQILELEINPLIHYLKIGAKEGRNPHPLFDTVFYLQQTQLNLEQENPLVHYLQKGTQQEYDPNPLFDTSFYLEQNPQIIELEINPLIHYLKIGAKEGRNPHPLFDTVFYSKQIDSNLRQTINPLAHFITMGTYQGLDPHPLFDTSHYLQNNSDVLESGINPLVHFIRFGAIEKREPFSLVEISELETKEQTLLNINYFSTPKSSDLNYQKWLDKNYPTALEFQKKAALGNSFRYQPLISIIMPVYNPPEQYLREAIESVLNQVYSNWELCIADDASIEAHVQLVLREYLEQDSRIKVIFREQNGHISKASNSALELATGEFIALLDHDDILTPHALYEVALLLNDHPEADMIYTDQDYMDDNGQLNNPYFKPDWCPDTFLANMYICHLGVYRHSIIREIGGFRVGFEGSQDYDLVLRFTEKTDRIFHIPDILYHWRTHAASTNFNPDAKSYAFVAARKALTEALIRRNEPGEVFDVPNHLGCYTIRYIIKEAAKVSIIIPTKNLGDILDQCLTSIFENTTYPNYEVILIDNGTTEAKAIKTINQWKIREKSRFKSYVLDIPFNFSKINNFAVEKSKGKYLLFLNNDIKIITSDWLEKMVEQAQRPSIGAVGSLLLYPDNTVQHAGVICGLYGSAGHSHKSFQYGTSGYFGRLIYVHNYTAITGACLMCRREVFEEVGGFEEKLAVSYNDIDLCLKIVDKGYRNVYLPHVILYHYESKTRGYDSVDSEKLARLICENMYILKKWQKFITHDPCYNPHLTIEKEDFSLKL